MQGKKKSIDPALAQLGVFLKHLRVAKRNLSLEKAAAKDGIDAPALSRIENGLSNPNFTTRGKLLKAYSYNDWEDLLNAANAHRPPHTRDIVNFAAEFDVLPTTEAAYTRLCEVITRLNKTHGIKDWFLGALHGVDERKRHPEKPDEEPSAQQEFGRLLADACNSVGQNRWRVQMVANLIHPDRLIKMEGLLKKTTNAIGFELKFVMLERSLSMLSPCILGNEDAFVGIQDIAYYRVQSAIHLRGVEANKWLRTHWDIIWGQARWLRRATVLERDVIDRIKAAHSGDAKAISELTR
ncbi:MAG: helix-turn-helix domain-containing protein [Planctomycetota bacterium]|nr:helix-turn-helix domain-containing protein [Planctomycetota bacterium]